MSGVVSSPFSVQSTPVRGVTGISAVRSALRYTDLGATTPPERLDSVDGLVSRLDESGLLAATRRDQCAALIAGAAPAAAGLIDGPIASFDLDPRNNNLQRSAQRFVDAREVRREQFLRDQQGQWRALWCTGPDDTSDEGLQVRWVLDAQEQLLQKEHGLAHAAPERERFLVVPPQQLPQAGGCLGSADPEKGLLFILDRQSQAEFLATAAHEAAHWSSVVRIATLAGDASTRIFGCGLSLGQLFLGLNEAYTSNVAHRIFQHGLRDRQSMLGQTARRVLPLGHLSPRARVHDTHDDTYRTQRRQLEALSARLYQFYTGDSAIGFAQFPLCTDPFAQTIRTYFAHAYFFGDLTIYAMLHQALGSQRFAELARLA